MKKLMLFMLSVLFTLVLGFSSCTGCKGEAQDNSINKDTTELFNKDSVVALNVEHAIALDRQTMFNKFGKDYRWYETEILLPEYLNSENVTSDPVMIVNIFQSVVERGKGFDTWVWKFQHFTDGRVLSDSIQGFWIENLPLNDKAIKLKYTEAFDKVMQVNYPKPQSKHVTLRNPVGPIAINTQWIFGNINEQIWVDAVTGTCTNSNPAFPKEKGFKMPLGEWP